MSWAVTEGTKFYGILLVYINRSLVISPYMTSSLLNGMEAFLCLIVVYSLISKLCNIDSTYSLVHIKLSDYAYIIIIHYN